MLRSVVLAALAAGCLAKPGNPVRPDYRWASPEAVENWHDMKFGLRIHWGLYAITAIGPESWPLNADKGKNQTFLKWYWDQAKTWNPSKYDADKWIALMKRAGMKYFDFTTKHHEGFSMYDTNTRVYDCWDFDLRPGATRVKGIKPCAGGNATFAATPHTKSTARVSRMLHNVTVAEAEAVCAADPACACFDYFANDDSGARCGAPGACATIKYDASSTAPDASNTLYTKQAGAPNDGVAYSSVSSFGRDVVGELVAAARRGGISPGLYFSNIDWFDADMRIDQWNAVVTAGHLCDGIACDPKRYGPTTDAEQWRRFVLRHRAQVLEILTKYGEIFEVSLDMNFPDQFDDDITDTIMLARELAPNTLFRGRGIGGKKEDGGYGDYNTPEETFPDKPVPGNWQVIYHGSNFMSYDPDPSHYVNGSFIIWHLADVVSKGGLMQIGYGPDKDGEFHPLAVKALEETGDWLRVNGEAIYATHPMPEHWNDTASSQVRYTRAKGAAASGEETIYAIALTDLGLPPLPPTLTVACVVPTPGSAIALLGYNGPVHWEAVTLPSGASAASISIPAAAAGLQGPGYTFKITGTPAAKC